MYKRQLPLNTVYTFDADVEFYLEVIAGIVLGCPSMALGIARRTRILNTACVDMLFRMAMWSLAMFLVVFEFLDTRSKLFYTPLPNGKYKSL